jgi:hypothetical protein
MRGMCRRWRVDGSTESPVASTEINAKGPARSPDLLRCASAFLAVSRLVAVAVVIGGGAGCIGDRDFVLRCVG